MDLDLNDSQHQTNPKSSDVLKRWLDGNQIYRIEKKENFTHLVLPFDHNILL